MFPIVSERYRYVIGIDTHSHKHVATVINNLGVVLYTREVRVTSKQMVQFVDWAVSKTGGEVLFAIEGTSSYGETLTSILLERHLDVAEVKPPKVKSRGGDGKTDQIDAELAALNVLRKPVHLLARPRRGETRKALRILLGARQQMVTEQSMSKNALIAIVRGMDLGIDARKPLPLRQYKTIAKWHIHDDPTSVAYIAKTEVKRLAQHVVTLQENLDTNTQSLNTLDRTMAPKLLEAPGVGPVTLATVLCAYSHKGRIRSPEAFAAIAGATPIPASSGNTKHYRLNRYGDRKLNNALHTITMARIRCDELTKAYVEKRTEQGLDIRDIKRSLKRYIARSLFKKLEALNIQS